MTTRVSWCTDSTRRTAGTSKSIDESDCVVDLGMVGMGCTKLIRRSCENESEGGELGTHARHLGLL
jgi:hypothetical protein